MLSLTVKKLDAFKFDGVAEFDNTAGFFPEWLWVATERTSMPFHTEETFCSIVAFPKAGCAQYEDKYCNPEHRPLQRDKRLLAGG